MSEKYTRETIENTRRQMQAIGYENVKLGMVEAVASIGSWLKLEDVKEFMPESDYQELLDTVESKVRSEYSIYEALEASKEELEEEIQDNIKRMIFVFRSDGKDECMIQEYFERRNNKITKTIDTKAIEGAKLAKTLVNVMQRHLDYGRFHNNGYYSAEQIERMLKDSIVSIEREGIVFEQEGIQIGEKNKTVLSSAIEATKTTKASNISEQGGIIEEKINSRNEKIK